MNNCQFENININEQQSNQQITNQMKKNIRNKRKVSKIERLLVARKLHQRVVVVQGKDDLHSRLT